MPRRASAWTFRSPALGALPVDLSKLNVKAEVLTLEGDEWQPVEKRDSDLTAKIVPGEAENEFSHAPDAARYAMSGRRSVMRIDPSNIRMLRTGV